MHAYGTMATADCQLCSCHCKLLGSAVCGNARGKPAWHRNKSQTSCWRAGSVWRHAGLAGRAASRSGACARCRCQRCFCAGCHEQQHADQSLEGEPMSVHTAWKYGSHSTSPSGEPVPLLQHIFPLVQHNIQTFQRPTSCAFEV